MTTLILQLILLLGDLYLAIEIATTDNTKRRKLLGFLFTLVSGAFIFTIQ